MINVLFVTYDFPYPTNSGGKSRAFNLMKYSASKDISLNLLSFVREDFDKKWENEVRKIGVKNIKTYKRKKIKSAATLFQNLISKGSIFKTLYSDEKFWELLKKMIVENNIDVVHFESSYTGYYIGRNLREMGIMQILGTENIEHLLYEDYIKNSKNPFKKLSLSYQVKRFKKEEEKMIKEADLCLAVTEGEAEYIRNISGKRCEVIENAVSIDELKFKFSTENKKNLLFVGNFSYMPNVKALKYFVKEVLSKFDSSVKLTVIGRKVNSVMGKNRRVVRKEFVEDLVSEYRKADALIFPIQIGGGTNFKVLEAMALGVPVIGFADKIKSTGARPNEEFFRADNSHDFLVQYERILTDKKAVERIVKNARNLIEDRYSWEKVGEKLNNIWIKVTNEKN